MCDHRRLDDPAGLIARERAAAAAEARCGTRVFPRDAADHERIEHAGDLGVAS